MLWINIGFISKTLERSRRDGGAGWSVLGPFGWFCERGAGRAGRSRELHWLRPQVSAGIKPHLRPPGGAGAGTALSWAPAPGVCSKHGKKERKNPPVSSLAHCSESLASLACFVVLVQS